MGAPLGGPGARRSRSRDAASADSRRAARHGQSGGEPGATLGPAGRDDRPAGPRAHAQPEAVCPRATTVVRLKGALAHVRLSGCRAVHRVRDRSAAAAGRLHQPDNVSTDLRYVAQHHRVKRVSTSAPWLYTGREELCGRPASAIDPVMVTGTLRNRLETARKQPAAGSQRRSTQFGWVVDNRLKPFPGLVSVLQTPDLSPPLHRARDHATFGRSSQPVEDHVDDGGDAIIPSPTTVRRRARRGRRTKADARA